MNNQKHGMFIPKPKNTAKALVKLQSKNYIKNVSYFLCLQNKISVLQYFVDNFGSRV